MGAGDACHTDSTNEPNLSQVQKPGGGTALPGIPVFTDGFDYIQYGAEGKTYSIVNGIKTPFADDKKDKQYNTNVGLELLQPEWLFVDTEKYTKFVSKDIAQYIIKKLDEYEKNSVYDYLRPNVDFPYRTETSVQQTQILTEGYSKVLLDTAVDADKTFEDTIAKWKAAGGDKVTGRS